MLNRALQVRVVKSDTNASHATLFDLDAVSDVAKDLGKDAVKVMVLYIALDTIRKVIVAKAS